MGRTDPQRHAVVIADAGPLIHLDELGCLDLLEDFREVWVPDAVWREVARHRPEALHRQGVALIRQGLGNSGMYGSSAIVDALVTFYTLHTGEREALALCLFRPGSPLLTDDTAARMAARSLNIVTHGTLGLLIRAVRRRQRTRGEVLELLAGIAQNSTLHIRPALLAEIIQIVKTEAA